jgi:hypothetical protein
MSKDNIIIYLGLVLGLICIFLLETCTHKKLFNSNIYCIEINEQCKFGIIENL